MALGNRAQWEFRNRLNEDFRITIKEEGYTSTTLEPIAQGEGFILNYRPVADDIANPLSPSAAEIYIINNSSAIDTLIYDIVQKQQTDFYVLIEKALTPGNYTPFWRGVILQDEIYEQDSPKPNVVQITATDGLAKLKNIDYDEVNSSAGGAGYPANTPFITILGTCLEDALPKELWGTSDAYLVTSVDFWETDQTYSASTDPLADLIIDVRGFRDVQERQKAELFNGLYGPAVLDIEYLSKKEVLEQLGYLFVSRIYQADGAWYFEQILLRQGATTKRMTYTKALTSSTYTNASTFTLIDQTSNKARRSGNNFTYLPALRRAEVEQRTFSSDYNNLLELDASSVSNSANRVFGLFSAQFFNAAVGTGQISQAFFFEFNFTNVLERINIAPNSTDAFGYGGVSGNTWRSRIRCKLDVTITVTAIATGTVYYWDGTAWTTSSSTYTIYSNYTDKLLNPTGGSSQTHQVFYGQFGSGLVINTAYIPATGVLEVTLDNLGFEYYAGDVSSANMPSWNTLSPTDYQNLGGRITMRSKTLLDEGETQLLVSVENPNTDVADYEVYRYPTLFIADKGIQSGLILYDNRTTVEACDTWEFGTNGEDITLPGLMIQKRLQLQSEPILKYEGNVIFTQSYNEGILFDSIRFVPHEWSFLAQSAEINGTWFQVGIYATAANPNEDFSFGGTQSMVSARTGQTPSNVQELQRRIQGIEFDEDTNVGTTLVNFRLGSEVYKATIVIDASASGSSTLGTDVYWIKLSWSGGNGTYVLNMNALIEGQEYKIYADSTITASTIVALTPDTENINGSSEYNIDGVGIYHVVAIDGEWVIYQ